ncbi:hypothetical protein [Kocuria palustris]|uniref:hypothetical protein n=1 Tax=Kocuria palustris TaxID=71999 RepID=UPI000738DBEA|nr:hypothetical protein [Kocuria palustris]KUG54815.1 hypothetical protein AVL60_00150 [Kocuria palustris]
MSTIEALELAKSLSQKHQSVSQRFFAAQPGSDERRSLASAMVETQTMRENVYDQTGWTYEGGNVLFDEPGLWIQTLRVPRSRFFPDRRSTSITLQYRDVDNEPVLLEADEAIEL